MRHKQSTRVSIGRGSRLDVSSDNDLDFSYFFWPESRKNIVPLRIINGLIAHFPIIYQKANTIFHYKIAQPYTSVDNNILGYDCVWVCAWKYASRAETIWLFDYKLFLVWLSVMYTLTLYRTTAHKWYKNVWNIIAVVFCRGANMRSMNWWPRFST